MKRLFSLIIVLTMVFGLLATSVQAEEWKQQVEYFPDGSYLVTDTCVSNTRSVTKVAEKSSKYYSADDVLQWKMTVMGEFVYDGTTCMCTYASGYYTIYNTSAWNVISDSASWGNNRATYTATFGYRVLGATASTKTFDLTMHCDQDGNIS